MWAKSVSKSSDQHDDAAATTGSSILKPRMSFHSLASSLLETRRYSDREKDLRAKQEELDDTRRKYQQEQENRKKLQLDNERLLSSQSDTGQKLYRATETTNKLRGENKKKAEQIEKLQRNINVLEDRVRNLEIRASEVEKAELTLESTRRNLESSVTECRSRETEIRKLTAQCEETEKKLKTAHDKIANLEYKISDLKLQVRQELVKNENIEKSVELIPRLREDVTERDKQIKQLEKEVVEKTALMVAARKAVRDYKDKLRDVDQKSDKAACLEEELKVATCEVETLKRLMSGKDHLVLQKCQALNLAKEVIDSFHTSHVNPSKLMQIQKMLERLCRTSVDAKSVIENGHVTSETEIKSTSAKLPGTRSHTFRPSSSPYIFDSNKENMIDINIPPFSSENSNQPHSKKSPRNRPKTATVYRSASFHESSKGTSSRSTAVSSAHSSQSSGSRHPSKHVNLSDYGFGSSKARRVRPYSAVVSSRREESDWDSYSSIQDHLEEMHKLSHEQRLALSLMSATEKDKLLIELIHVGDRVSVTVPQKPPRYGRKTARPVVYRGMVKYIGNLDKPHADARMYVGIKLDEPNGNSDGVYKGKRYMFTPQNQGKFFKMKDVTSLLNVKSGCYVPLTKVMIFHLMQKAEQTGEMEVNSENSGTLSPR